MNRFNNKEFEISNHFSDDKQGESQGNANVAESAKSADGGYKKVRIFTNDEGDEKESSGSRESTRQPNPPGSPRPTRPQRPSEPPRLSGSTSISGSRSALRSRAAKNKGEKASGWFIPLVIISLFFVLMGVVYHVLG